MNDCYYIAELNLPSKSAYAVHVFQMCNALSKSGLNVTLLIPYVNSKTIKNLKNNFAIKHNFKIRSVFKKKRNINFINRYFFSRSCLNYLKNKNKTLIISRSIISSILLSKNNIFNYLEIHHELKGLTKFLHYLNKKSLYKNIKYILINKYLLNFFQLKKKKYLILDDAVNKELFKNYKVKKLKNTCAYFGSLTKGKGIELIYEIAKKIKNIHFHIYGDLSLLQQSSKNLYQIKNIHFFNYINYKNIPKIMSRYEVVLMPYLEKVSVRSNNLNTAKYMSPLKLFEYLSMSKIIIATKLSVYSHILKHNKNSILIPPNRLHLWEIYILKIFKNLKNFESLKEKAKKTSLNYTWDLRVKKINSDFIKLD